MLTALSIEVGFYSPFIYPSHDDVRVLNIAMVARIGRVQCISKCIFTGNGRRGS